MKTLNNHRSETPAVPATTFEDVVEVSIVVDSLKRRYALVIGITILTMAAGVGAMLLQPPKWSVTSTLYFPIRPISLLSPLSGSAAEASAAVGLGGPNPLNVNQSILESQSVLDYVHTQVPKDRVWLEKKLEVRPDLTSSLLSVSVDDNDTALGRRIVRAYIDGLRLVSNRLDIAPMSSDLEHIKSSLNAWQSHLDRAQAELLAFQKGQTTPTQVVASGGGDAASVLVLPGNWLEQAKTSEVELHRINAEESQTRARIQRMSQTPLNLPTDVPSAEKWRDRLVSEQFDLRVAQLTQPDSSPSVQMLKEQIDLTQQQLKEETSKYFQAVKMNVALPAYLDLLDRKVSTEAQLRAVDRLAATAPSQAARYQSLLTQYTTDNAIVQKLRAQEVSAELKASVDAHHWQVLDDARVSDRPVNKSFGKTLALSGVVGLLLGLLASAVANSLQRRRSLRRQTA